MNVSKKFWLLELKKMEAVALERARTVGTGRSYFYEEGNQLTCICKMSTMAVRKGHAIYWEINHRRIAKKDIIECLKRLHKT